MAQHPIINGRRTCLVDSKIKAYDEPKYTENFTIDVLASNSNGNASVLNGSILIDHGLQSKDLKKILDAKILPDDIEDKFSLFITHGHFDHFRPDSILRTIVFDDLISDIYASADLINKFMDLVEKVATGEPDALIHIGSKVVTDRVTTMHEAGEFAKMVHVIEDGTPVQIDDMAITPISVEHYKLVDGKTEPVPCFAFEVERNGSHYLHATDLVNTEPLKKMYELIAIENNYSTMLVQSGKYLNNAAAHLSSEAAQEFVSSHLIDGGEYIELHKSDNLALSIEDVITYKNTQKEMAKND